MRLSRIGYRQQILVDALVDGEWHSIAQIGLDHYGRLTSEDYKQLTMCAQALERRGFVEVERPPWLGVRDPPARLRWVGGVLPTIVTPTRRRLRSRHTRYGAR